MAGDDFSSKEKDVAAAANFIEEETLREVMTDSEREAAGLPAGPGAEGTDDWLAERAREERELMERGMCVPRLGPTTASLGIKSVVEDCITGSEGPGKSLLHHSVKGTR